jgi:hypothetical protein
VLTRYAACFTSHPHCPTCLSSLVASPSSSSSTASNYQQHSGCSILCFVSYLDLQEFCEECEGGYRVVRRDNGRYSDAELPAVLRQRTGELIYVGLRDGFRVSESELGGSE